MVVDSVKGVETVPQTDGSLPDAQYPHPDLYQQARPGAGMPPLDILAHIEDKLQIECAPLSWPIGTGRFFRGTYNLYRKKLNLFKPGQANRSEMITIHDVADPFT